MTISDLKAGLWDGSLDVARLQVHLPSKEKKLRFEAQLKLDGVRSQSIINIFGEARKQPGVVPLDWKGAWRISGAGEIPMDQPENFRWNGDMALDGELVYASGQTNIALQKPTFSVRVEEQAVTISDLKAGLWDGSLDVARLQVASALEGEETANRNAAQPRRRRDCNRSSTVLAKLASSLGSFRWTGRAPGESAARERSRWITLRTSAGMVTWHSMASSSMRAAKQTSHCRSRLFQCAWRSRR